MRRRWAARWISSCPGGSGVSLRAMVLGDGSGISEEDMGNFRELGVSTSWWCPHAHDGAAAFLQLALKRLPIRKAVGNLLTGLCLLLFLALSGFQPSATRGAGHVWGCFFGGFRRPPLRRAQLPGAGGAGRVPGQPLCRGRLGLRLSVTATLGIVLLYAPLGAGFPGKAPAGPGLCPVEAGGGLPAATGRALLGTFPGAAGGVWGIPPCCCLCQLPHGGPPARPCCTWLRPVPF